MVIRFKKKKNFGSLSSVIHGKRTYHEGLQVQRVGWADFDLPKNIAGTLDDVYQT